MLNGKLVGLTALCLVLGGCGGNSGGGSTGGGTPQNVNAAPVATGFTETLIQDSAAISITLTATDADGDTLTYNLGTQPSSGTASLSGNVVSYTPDAEFSGMDSFTFTASDGTVSSNVATVDLTIQPASNFAGRLTKADGSIVPNVSVEALDGSGGLVTTLTADVDGNFLLKAVTEQELTLNFSADGYANQVIPVTMPSLKSMTIPLDVVMIERGAEQIIDIDAGGTLSAASGASVTLSSGSFVAANGAAVTGNITATITPVDISDPQILAAFPGEFTGMLEMSGTATAIASLGTVEYIFTQNGEPLQLAQGATAEVELPIFSPINPQNGSSVEMGDEIELWSLNEDTGIWEQEGSGIVVANIDSPTGLALKATVSHFTWWNVDYPVDVADVDVTLNGNVDGGVAVIHARVNGFPGFRAANVNVTVGSTASGLVIPQNQTTCFWIEYMDVAGGTAFSDEQCVTNAIAGSTYPLTFNVLTAGSLTINDSIGYRNSYFTGKPVNISLRPSSLETSVSYAVTSGTLPSGITLSAPNPTSGLISGSSTALGNYSVTVTGTDSDGFMDTKDISFSIIDTPPPDIRTNSLGSTEQTFYLNVPDFLFLRPRVLNNGGDAPTSWIVTNADGSQVSSGVTINSLGDFRIDSFDGTTASYLITAYNNKGASNAITITVRDVATSPPVLNSAHQIMYLLGDGTITENLSGLNTGAPADSWTITNPDGSAPPSSVSITNAGVVSLNEGDAMSNRYSVIAYNGSLASGVMELSFLEDMTMPPDCTDPNDPFC